MAIQFRESLREEESEIFKASLYAAKQWLGALWSDVVSEPKLTVVMSDRYSSDKIINETTNTADKDERFRLPTVDLVIVGIKAGESRYSKFNLQAGVVVGYQNGRAHVRQELLTPIDVLMGVQFECNTAEESHLFGQLWQRACPAQSFNIVQPGTGAKFTITISLDDQVDIPQRGENSAPDNADTIVVQTTAILKTYTGRTRIDPTVKNMSIGFSVPSKDENDPDGWAIERLDLDKVRTSRIVGT